MKKTLSILLTSVLAFSLVACGVPAKGNEVAKTGTDVQVPADTGSTPVAKDAKNVIIASNATSKDHMYNIGLAEFKSVLEDVSGGQMTATTHEGTIGTDESELVEKLQMGAADVVIASPGFMTTVGIPEVDILSLYYLFDSVDTWKESVNGEFGDKLTDLITEKSNNQFRVLGYWSSGIRNYYGKSVVKSPADINGTTIRCQTAPVVKSFWEGTGAIPTSISWNELYQALEQGVVDAAENDYVSFSQKDHHKTRNGKNISETQHTYLTPVLLTTGAFYDGLTDEQRGWFDEAVEASTKLEQNITFELGEEAKLKVINEGGNITNFEDMDIEAFREIAIPLQDEFAKKYGMEEYLELVRK